MALRPKSRYGIPDPPDNGPEGGVRNGRTRSRLRCRDRRRRPVRIGARRLDQAGDGRRRLRRRRRSGGAGGGERKPFAHGCDRRRAAASPRPYRRMGNDRATGATDPVDGDHGRGRARRSAPPPSQFRRQRPRAARLHGVQRRCRRRPLRSLRPAWGSARHGLGRALGFGQAYRRGRACRRPRIAHAPRSRRRRRALETRSPRRYRDGRLGLRPGGHGRDGRPRARSRRAARSSISCRPVRSRSCRFPAASRASSGTSAAPTPACCLLSTPRS